ncbi:Flp family type IVb pilin [Dermatophilaceae bacterium Soc4.6]
MLQAFVHLKVRLATRDRGATAVEYGLMVAGIAVVIIGLVFGLGKTLGNFFGTVNTTLTNKG